MNKKKDWESLIAQGESQTIEFKSDRNRLKDQDLIEAIVCLANGSGGWLFLGVEDDGKVTGLHSEHQTRPEILSAFIASRTAPPLSVEISFEDLDTGNQQLPVAIIQVPTRLQPVATSDGKLLVRYVDTQGNPGCRPLYPNELAGWRASRGQVDPTAEIIPNTSWDDLDPLEFVRLRRLVEENRGDTALSELSNKELAKALGVVRMEDTALTPTLAGLLLLGKETALRRYLPTHEVAFQVLHGTDVAVNEFRHWPLLRIQEWLLEAIEMRNEEKELMVNGIRIGVSRYAHQAIREAIHNALIHRDYGRLGAVHVQIHDDYMLISNPGGFVEGVRIDNLLRTAPRPRNPRLSDAFKRVGLVERTGRGVGIIYAAQLRNGRPTPNYERSTEVNVTVTLHSGAADMDFVRLTIQVRRQLERELRANDLLILWEIWHQGQVAVNFLQPLLQRDKNYVSHILETLKRHHILQEVKEGIFKLSFNLAREYLPEYTPEDEILSYIEKHKHITRRDTAEICDLTLKQAEYRLKLLVNAGKIKLVGQGRGAYYVLSDSVNSG